MKVLDVIYWSRVGFGILAAVVCILLRVHTIPNPLISGITVGFLVYLITYYILKYLFMNKVEQASKIVTMGIGAYFLTWIVAWVLFLTVTLTF